MFCFSFYVYIFSRLYFNIHIKNYSFIYKIGVFMWRKINVLSIILNIYFKYYYENVTRIVYVLSTLIIKFDMFAKVELSIN